MQSMRKAFAPVVLMAAFVVCAAPVVSQEHDRTPDVPYVPTSQEVVDEMLKLAGVKQTDTVYDLGCGDGRIVITAAQKFGAKGVGVDINPERIQEATENAKKAGVTGKVKFVEGDLFTADIHDASVVTLYLLPSVNLKLRPKLLKDLRPGTRIVSHSFDMGDWKPDKEVDVNGRKIYLWTVSKAATRAHANTGQ
jgi:SAM-dependent methyltransferase